MSTRGLLTSALLSTLLVVAPPAGAEDGGSNAPVRVTVASDGAELAPDWPGTFIVDATPDGRFITFETEAAATAGDTNHRSDIFRRDMVTGEVELVSLEVGGGQHAEYVRGGSISDDGTRVAYQLYTWTYSSSRALVIDMTTSATTVVATPAYGPVLSGAGTHVAFTGNGLADDTTPGYDLYVADLGVGTVVLASRSSTGEQPDAHVSSPDVSADGRYVAFDSEATNLVPGDTNATDDVFVRDLLAGTTERVSVADDGTQFQYWSAHPKISGDGRVTAFDTAYLNVEIPSRPAYNPFYSQILARDRVTLDTLWVSRGPNNRATDAIDTWVNSISADGRFVGFESDSDRMVPHDNNKAIDAFVNDLSTGVTHRVSTRTDNEPVKGRSGDTIALSGGGAFFNSEAGNLVAGDTNEVWDGYFRSRPGACPSGTDEEGPLSAPAHRDVEPAVPGLSAYVHGRNCEELVARGY